MNRVIFQDWFDNNFVPEVRNNLVKLGKPTDTKCLLLLDNSATHPAESELVSDCGNIFSCFLPPNVTSLIQPMDQGVIKNFKCLYRNDFMMRMVSTSMSPPEFQRYFTIKDAIFSFATAWNSVNSETLLRAWKKLWPDAISADLDVDQCELLENIQDEQQTGDVQAIVNTVKLAAETNPLSN